jgi:hypothetical protein
MEICMYIQTGQGPMRGSKGVLLNDTDLVLPRLCHYAWVREPAMS